jgi:hypothetical protein
MDFKFVKIELTWNYVVFSMIKFFNEILVAFNHYAISCIFSHHNVRACGVQRVTMEHDNVEQHNDAHCGGANYYTMEQIAIQLHLSK